MLVLVKMTQAALKFLHLINYISEAFRGRQRHLASSSNILNHSSYE